jgi:protein-disulfide isomerase-like protein with CxxC motif
MRAGNEQLPGLPNLPQAAKFGVREMASQIVMDRTGDTRHIFDNQDRAEVTKAEQRFKELTGAGFTAAVRSGLGEQRIVRSFDPTAEETLFYPRLVGG